MNTSSSSERHSPYEVRPSRLARGRGRRQRCAGDRRPRRRHRHHGLGRPGQHQLHLCRADPRRPARSRSASTSRLLPPTATAGMPVPAGSLPLQLDRSPSRRTPQGLLDVVQAYRRQVRRLRRCPSATPRAKAPVKWDTKTPAANPDDPTVYSGKGANAAFTLPEAGSLRGQDAAKLHADRDQGRRQRRRHRHAAPRRRRPRSAASCCPSRWRKVKAKAPKSAKQSARSSPSKGKVSNEFAKTGGPAATGKLIVKDGKQDRRQGQDPRRASSPSRSRASRWAPTRWS